MSYFKIPIAKLLPKIPRRDGQPVVFNESQWGMVQGLEQHRFWVHIAARRTGKSYAAAILAVAKLLEPNQLVMVVAPTYGLSTIIWEYVVDIIRDLGIETEIFRTKDYTIKFKHGSLFRLLSANKRESLIGRAANLLIIDEAAVIENEEYFTRDLRPVLSTFADSRCLFISTPRGQQNYLFKYFERSKDAEKYPEWGSARYTWRANPLLAESEIEEAKNTLPNSLYRQEYECDWLSYVGQIYTLSETNKKDLSTFTGKDNRYRIIAGLDLGYRDETVFVVIATDGDTFYVVDEFRMRESTTAAIAEQIREKITQWEPESIYIDSAAQQSKADLAYDHDIYCENAQKDVNAGIAAIQNLIEADKLILDPSRCPVTYESLQGYHWNAKTEIQKPAHDHNSHACDALRYAIYTFQRTQPDIYVGN